MKILALSGSLRAASSNTNVLLAAKRLAPPELEITLYRGISDLPHFNPDVESATIPPIVAELRAQVEEAAALLICCPEYAHGVPGSFKNALDWLVGIGLNGKPVGLINASPRSTFVHASLTEILITMGANMVARASPIVPLMGPPLDEIAIADHPELSASLRAGLAALAEASGRGA
ncbi:MAG TPA: NADPH-dependent FMN reductase [Polyangiaceae bacterium]|nr:NADPH-dependent FMN reductase [Polyangiaceae bacterium]